MRVASLPELECGIFVSSMPSFVAGVSENRSSILEDLSSFVGVVFLLKILRWTAKSLAGTGLSDCRRMFSGKVC